LLRQFNFKSGISHEALLTLTGSRFDQPKIFRVVGFRKGDDEVGTAELRDVRYSGPRDGWIQTEGALQGVVAEVGRPLQNEIRCDQRNVERRPGERHQHRDAAGVVAENIVRHARDEVVGMGEGVGKNEVLMMAVFGGRLGVARFCELVAFQMQH